MASLLGNAACATVGPMRTVTLSPSALLGALLAVLLEGLLVLLVGFWGAFLLLDAAKSIASF